jgi:hypothetical protein
MEKSLLRDSEVTRYDSFCHRYFLHNWDSPKKKHDFIMRLLGLLVGILSIFWATRISMPKVPHSQCMVDRIFDMTSPLNDYFAKNPQVKDAFVILSSSLIDFNLLCFAILYGLWGTTWRPIVFAASFYAIRGFLQASTVLGFPEGFIWEFPGVYSVLITYVKSSDFFYSGHVGVMLFCGLYFHEHKHEWLAFYSIFCIACEAIIMVLVRCHYGIDIFGGLIFCHYFWTVCEIPSRFVDKLGYELEKEDKHNKV